MYASERYEELLCIDTNESQHNRWLSIRFNHTNFILHCFKMRNDMRLLFKHIYFCDKSSKKKHDNKSLRINLTLADKAECLVAVTGPEKRGGMGRKLGKCVSRFARLCFLR